MKKIQERICYYCCWCRASVLGADLLLDFNAEVSGEEGGGGE